MNRYQGIDPSSVIGSGSYGVVYKVQDRFTKETFALKKLVDEKHSTSTRLGVPYYVIREISVLRELRHENIVSLRECVFDENGSLSLVFEYMETDLHQFIQDQEDTLHPDTVRSLLYQCLSGIACCHESGIIHRGKFCRFNPKKSLP
jgi:serine/threonine protein kinase